MRWLPIAVLAGFLAGCASAPRSSHPTDRPSDAAGGGEVDGDVESRDPFAAGVQRPRPTIRLMRGGRAPRAALRTHYTAGAMGKLTLRIRTKMDLRIDGARVKRKIPATVATAEVEVTHVSNERVRLRYQVVDFRIDERVDDDGTKPEVALAMQDSLAKATGRDVFSVLDHQGVVLSSEQGPEVQADPNLESLENALGHLTIALPDQPIGIGGVWQVESERVAGGVRSEVRTIYRVVAIDADEVTLRFNSKQVGVAGIIEGTDLPSDAEMELLELRGKESGRVTLNLSQPHPAKLKSKSESRSQSRLTAGGSAQLIDVSMKTELELIPGG